MPQALIGAVAAPLVGAIAGKAIGGGGAKNAQPALPKDLQGLRGNNIGLLNYLLGFGGGMPGQGGGGLGMPQMPNGGQSQQGGGVGVYAPGGKNGWGGAPGQTGFSPNIGPSMDPSGIGGRMLGAGMSSMGGMLGGGGAGFNEPGLGGRQALTNQATGGMGGGFGGGQGGPPQGSPGAGMLGRMESYFGPLGTPTTALQQQSLGGISQFLNSNPYGQSNSALQGIMGGGGHDYFGGAQGAFNDVKGANYFGGAQGAFDKLQGGNYFGGAQNAFNSVAGENPFTAAQGALEGMFRQNPGQGMLDALRPSFDRNLAAANQQGGRFGSANAILRSRAVDDYNLLGAQALQHGVDQQINAAGQYGMMGNSLLNAHLGAGQGLLGVGQGQMNQQNAAAQGMLGVGQGRMQQGLGAAQGLLGVGQGRSSYGLGLMANQLGAAGQLAQNQNSMFNNLQGGYNTGTAQAQQEAQRQQQALSILMGQLGVSQQATFGAPTVVQPSGAQQGLQAGLGLTPFLYDALKGGGGGGGGGTPFSNPGAAAPSFGIPYKLGK